ncbi:MAG: DUF4962 domain-containing protein [Rhodospirillaceae bacterium]|nr:DUF4962 domain-containing protein [Rhodospirillaceae bacterium]
MFKRKGGLVARRFLALLMALGSALAMPAPALADKALADGASPNGALPDAADPYLLLRGVSTVQPIRDWLAPVKPTAVQPYPANGAVVKQTPPVFRWPYQDKILNWEFQLRLDAGRGLRHTVTNNWLFLDRTLPPGRHAWRLRGWPMGANATVWSEWRQFTVPRNAHAFVIPDFTDLFETAQNRDRPRHLPQGGAGKRLFAAIRSGERRRAFELFRHNVDREFLKRPMSAEPVQATFQVANNYEKQRLGLNIARTVYRDAGAARAAAYVWIVTEEKRYLDAAMDRGRNLAAWDPKGSTGRRSQGSISREIALTLAIVLDLTYEQWSDGERALIETAITIRVRNLFNHYILADRLSLAEMPYNSHGFRHAGAIAAIASLLAGSIPDARHWFLTTFPVYLAMNNPWGGDDGGFANGLNYAGWNLMAQLRQGDILEHATGLALRHTARLREAGQYLRFFAPPGTPDNLFGDGHERDVKRLWRQLANAYARRLPRPYYRRYASDWGAATATPDNIFAALPRDAIMPDGGEAVPSPHAAHFPSIGWTAMHSDLTDPNRTSVYFLASPYGSLNHSHAAQNSFVIHSRGRRLAISSGYYDFFGSDHHKQWTQQSKSKNTITYDGGRGQPSHTKSAAGDTVGFAHGANLDFVVGDAARAYGNGVMTARRTLAFLRPNTILVYDQLRADQARRWEWNIHAVDEILDFGPNAMAIKNGPVSLCVEMLAAPAMEFSVNNQFPAPPDGQTDRYPAQWHGVFTTREKKTKAEFLALLSVDCATPPIGKVSASKDGGFSLAIEGKTYSINATGAVRH